MLKVAHISDLHFFCPPVSYKELLGGNWKGVCNYVLFRRKTFDSYHLTKLLGSLKSNCIDELWISGDLTVSGTKKEFLKAIEILNLDALEIPFRIIPGNHDLRSNEKSFFCKTFYASDDIVSLSELSPFWDLISLDLSFNGKNRDQGLFCEKSSKMLDFALCQSSKPSIAIMCHYPLKSGPNDKNPLQKESSLQQVLLKDPRVKLYVHGHNHRQSCFAVEHIHCASAGLIRSKFGEYNIYTFTDEQVNILLKNTEKGSL